MIRQEFAALKATQAAQHQQNRTDIHRLSNGQEAILLTLQAGLKEIATAVATRCSAIEQDVQRINLRLAKASGYVAAISVVGAILFELVKLGIEHIK